jgi:hypothetical protein
MQLRYFCELFVFFAFACLFQYMIGNFVTSFRNLKLELKELTYLKATGKLKKEIYQKRDEASLHMQESGEQLQLPLYLALLTFSFPIKTLMTYIYSVKTKNEYKLRSEDIFDFLISILVLGWIGIFLYKSN